MDKPMALDEALSAWQDARAAEQQATLDLVASIEHTLTLDIVDATIDWSRALSWLLPIKERGLTETTRKGLVATLEMARNNMGMRT